MATFFAGQLPPGPAGDRIKKYLKKHVTKVRFSNNIDELSDFMHSVQDSTENPSNTQETSNHLPIHAGNNLRDASGINAVDFFMDIAPSSSSNPSRNRSLAVVKDEAYTSQLISQDLPLPQQEIYPIFPEVKEEVENFEEPDSQDNTTYMAEEEAAGNFYDSNELETEIGAIKKEPTQDDSAVSLQLGDPVASGSSDYIPIPWKAYCDICEKGQRSVADLKVHIRSHTGERPYECDQCQMRFTQKSGLKTHMLTHNEEKLFECDVCLRRFHHKFALTKHFRTHTGEKPFECPVCQQKFAVRSNMTRHYRIMHCS